MKITVKKLSELHKPAHNIRRHSEKQLTEYIRSIEMFGQVKPLVVAEDGEIIAGNGLYPAHSLDHHLQRPQRPHQGGAEPWKALMYSPRWHPSSG